MGKLLAWPLLGLVWLYRNAISPLLGMNCRFEPTCSAYAIEALHRYGGFKGGWLMLKRLSRCHPWGGSGYDPVPILPIIYPERTVGTEHSSVPGSEPIVKDQRKLGTKSRSVPGSEPGSDPKVLSESTIGSDPIIDSEKTSGSEQDSDPRAG